VFVGAGLLLVPPVVGVVGVEDAGAGLLVEGAGSVVTGSLPVVGSVVPGVEPAVGSLLTTGEFDVPVLSLVTAAPSVAGSAYARTGERNPASARIATAHARNSARM
jgi:hypothetical protein